MIHAASLAQTIDAVNEAAFFDTTIPTAQRKTIAEASADMLRRLGPPDADGP